MTVLCPVEGKCETSHSRLLEPKSLLKLQISLIPKDTTDLLEEGVQLQLRLIVGCFLQCHNPILSGLKLRVVCPSHQPRAMGQSNRLRKSELWKVNIHAINVRHRSISRRCGAKFRSPRGWTGSTSESAKCTVQQAMDHTHIKRGMGGFALALPSDCRTDRSVWFPRWRSVHVDPNQTMMCACGWNVVLTLGGHKHLGKQAFELTARPND